MRTLTISAAWLAFAFFAYPGAAQDHPNLAGTWQLDSAKSEQNGTVKMSDATWVIEEGDNTIHITETADGNTKKIDLKCSTDGKDCSIGNKAKASFWYNGPMLVEVETRGDHVNRYRMKLSDDAKALRVELSSIVPQGEKADVLVFHKQ